MHVPLDLVQTFLVTESGVRLILKGQESYTELYRLQLGLSAYEIKGMKLYLLLCIKRKYIFFPGSREKNFNDYNST